MPWLRKSAARCPARHRPPNLREPEWQMLSHPDPDRNSRDFQLRVVEPPAQYRHVVSRVVLAERLREVRSLIGFTRIESQVMRWKSRYPPDQRVPLSRARPQWVPTCDVRGEGIFLQISEEAIQTWVKSKVVERLEHTFFGAHQRWRSIRKLEPQDGYPDHAVCVASFSGPCAPSTIFIGLWLYHGQYPRTDLLTPSRW